MIQNNSTVQKKKKLRQLNIAVLGARGHGKTSVVNWLTGKQYLIDEAKNLQQLSLQKVEVASESKSSLIGEVVIEPQVNQTYFTTMKRQHYYLYHQKYHINIFDLPADQDLIRIKNVMCIQNILFVVSAKNNDLENNFSEIKHILIQCELLNVKRIVFAINFMDHWPSCNWNKQKYLDIVDKIKSTCQNMFKYKKEPLQLSFCPTCGNQGENILKKSGVDLLKEHGICKWMEEDNIPCLLKEIEISMINKGKTKTQRETKYNMKMKPLRFSVLGTIPRDLQALDEIRAKQELGIEHLQIFEDYELDEENVLGVFAYIHSGKIRQNTKILMQPRQCFTVVKNVEFFTPFQFEQHKKVQNLFEDQNEVQQKLLPTHASAGQLCFIYFHNKERIKVPIGTIGGVPIYKKIPLEADSIIVKVKVIHPTQKMRLNRLYHALCGMQQFEIRMFDVQCIFDSKLGKVNFQSSQFPVNSVIENKYVYQVQMSIFGSVCLEKFQYIPSCGQIFIFTEEGTILAIARVEEIGLKFQSLDHLPRVFAVPKNQLIDPKSQEQREDWNLCQVDLTSTINTLCLPCGHIKMCELCTKKINKCPFCNIQVFSTRKMQAIEMEDNVDLMEFALCDSCHKNRISHAVLDCEHYQCICDECWMKTVDEPQCRLCKKDHLIMSDQIDLSKLEAVPFKNTIGVLNEYILNTLDFINKFGHCNENKLYELDQVLDEIESKVLLLEKKLDSIPPEVFNAMPQTQQAAPVQAQQSQPSNTNNDEQDLEGLVIEQQTSVVVEAAPVEELDDQMKKYIKMINMGVPLPHVKMKMTAEGYDPNTLDQHI